MMADLDTSIDGGNIMILEFDHGSICVGDINEGIRFYTDVVGLKQISRPDFGFPGAWFTAGSIPVHLTTGGLLRGLTAPLRANESHLAFCVVEGLEDLLLRFEIAGCQIYEFENSPAAERQIFILDPWGNVLEFCTYTESE